MLPCANTCAPSCAPAFELARRCRGASAGPRALGGACAHAFGYRGHCLTKSRRYSTTFKQLRADREAWVHEQILARSRDAAQRALAEAKSGSRPSSTTASGT